MKDLKRLSLIHGFNILNFLWQSNVVELDGCPVKIVEVGRSWLRIRVCNLQEKEISQLS